MFVHLHTYFVTISKLKLSYALLISTGFFIYIYIAFIYNLAQQINTILTSYFEIQI